MRRESQLICRKYKSPAFHNVGDLNQLNPLKIISLGFACKGNEKFSTIQAVVKEKARSLAGFEEFHYNSRFTIWKKLLQRYKEKATYTSIYSNVS